MSNFRTPALCITKRQTVNPQIFVCIHFRIVCTTSKCTKLKCILIFFLDEKLLLQITTSDVDDTIQDPTEQYTSLQRKKTKMKLSMYNMSSLQCYDVTQLKLFLKVL